MKPQRPASPGENAQLLGQVLTGPWEAGTGRLGCSGSQKPSVRVSFARIFVRFLRFFKKGIDIHSSVAVPDATLLYS